MCIFDWSNAVSIQLDASSAGDSDVRVNISEVAEVAGFGYGGRKMRIVWFD